MEHTVHLVFNTAHPVKVNLWWLSRERVFLITTVTLWNRWREESAQTSLNGGYVLEDVSFGFKRMANQSSFYPQYFTHCPKYIYLLTYCFLRFILPLCVINSNRCIRTVYDLKTVGPIKKLKGLTFKEWFLQTFWCSSIFNECNG